MNVVNKTGFAIQRQLNGVWTNETTTLCGKPALFETAQVANDMIQKFSPHLQPGNYRIQEIK